MKLFHLHRDTFDPNGVMGQFTGPGEELGEVLLLQSMENPATLIPASPLDETGAPVPFVCVRDMYWSGDGPGGKADYPTFRITMPTDVDGDGVPDLEWFDRDRDGVADRNLMKIHRLNYAHQSDGCIGLGMERGYTDGHVPAIWRSTHAHALYMASLVGEERHGLIITEGPR